MNISNKLQRWAGSEKGYQFIKCLIRKYNANNPLEKLIVAVGIEHAIFKELCFRIIYFKLFEKDVFLYNK